MTTVSVDAAALRGLLTSPTGPVWRDTQRRANRVLNAARRNAPVDEGRLRGSLSLRMQAGPGGEPIGVVGSNLRYAIFVHEGTGIYAGRGFIRPRRARVMRWPVKNNSGVGRRRFRGGSTARYAYATKVRGVKGRPFLRDALQAAG